MNRIIPIALAMLLAANPIARAEDKDYALPSLGSKHEYLDRVDVTMSPAEYELTHNHNQKLVREHLLDYSRNALELMGVPTPGILFMGAAYALYSDGPKFNLNKSKTLTLELDDMEKPGRTLYFRINFDW